MISRWCSLLLAVVVTSAAAADPSTLVGEVTHVRDGDTIEVRGVPVRLDGLAAPERGEPGYREAKAAIVALAGGEVVRCDLSGARSYDRHVGICYLDGVDLAASMVWLGVARDCPAYSGGRYREIELAHGAAIGGIYPLPSYCR